MTEIVLRALQSGDGGWVIARHAALYADEEGYDATFEALVAEIVAGFLRSHDPLREGGWIAERGGTRLGSLLVLREAEDVAKLRLVLVEPEARGTGLARRILDTAMKFARAAGHTTMRLWTHESHVAAGRLYARAGFRRVSATPGHQFGQPVVGQIRECGL